MDDEQIRDQLAAQIKQYGAPSPTKDAIQEKQWQKIFGQRHILIDIETAMWSLNRRHARTDQPGAQIYAAMPANVYCLSCVEDMPNRGIKAYQLHVRWEDDPLKNVPMLVRMMCFHCDFEQYVGMKQDPRVSTIPIQGDMFGQQQQQSSQPWQKLTTSTTDPTWVTTTAISGSGISSGSSLTSLSSEPPQLSSGSWWPWSNR